MSTSRDSLARAIEAAIIPGAAVDIEFLCNDEGCCWTYAELVTP